MCLPLSARTSVYAALCEFCGIVLNPTALVPSAVQLARFPDVGVPSIGAVRVSTHVLELNARLELDFNPRFQVAAVTKVTKHVVSVASFAIVDVVDIAAVPVVFWLNVGKVFVPEVRSLFVRVCVVVVPTRVVLAFGRVNVFSVVVGPVNFVNPLPVPP
jgi:hypothetical protein